MQLEPRAKCESYVGDGQESLQVFLFNYISILNSTFILLLRKKNTISQTYDMLFSNARLLFLNPSIVVSPLFFNFDLPVTHLMVTLSIMQPHPRSS